MADENKPLGWDRKHPWSRSRRRETRYLDPQEIAVDVEHIDPGEYRRKGSDIDLGIEVSVKRAKRKERREDSKKRMLLDEEM